MQADPHRSVAILGLALALAASPLLGLAQTAFQPAGLFVAEATQTLPAAPVDLAVSAAGLFLIFGTDTKGGRIVRLSATTLAQQADAALPMTPQTIAINSQDGTLFVVGTDGKQSLLMVLDQNFAVLATVPAPALFAHPTLRWSAPNLLTIGDYAGEKGQGDFRVVDVSAPAKPVFLPAPRLASAARGITGSWYDPTLGVAFLARVTEPSLLAIDTKNDQRIAGFTFQYKSQPILEPFSVVALLPGQRCDGGTDPSFLISDRNRDRLSLVEYTDYFRALTLVTEIEPRLRLLPGTTPELLAGLDGILRPSGLIASTCDHGVIWLGSLYSDEVIQYAFNPAAQSLEKVGSISLRALPLALVLSDDRQSGLALLSNGELQRFVAPLDGSGGLIGDVKVRELQRVLTEKGYPVGAIDGFLGARTQNALAQFQIQNGIVLDPTKDIEGALGAISGSGS